MLPTVVLPDTTKAGTAYRDAEYDIAVLPLPGAAEVCQPFYTWLSEPARGAKLPVVWLGRKDAAAPAGCTAPSVHLGAFVDPIELSQALSDLLTAADSGPAQRGRKTEKAPPLAETLPLSILAAEDNATNREVIKIVLRNLGYKVDLVENGAEAVQAVLNKKYDLLLLDMQMPVMDGLTAAREICRLIPDPTKRLKIVALTANALAGDRERCLDAGMDEYLTKPILPVVLASCIRRVFQFGESARPGTSHPMPTRASSPELPWFDTLHLETITLGLPPEQALSTLRQLHASVCSDFRATFPVVLECCEQKNQARFAEAIHGLKGCFMMIGWNRAANFCADALTLARKDEFTEWQSFPNRLKAAFEHSSEAMVSHLDNRSIGIHQSDTPAPGAPTGNIPSSP
jgi:CheY-like chemotaxis protein